MSEELIPIEQDNEDRLPRCTQLEKKERVNEVADMLGELKSNKEIEKFLMEKYNLTKSSTEPYLREGREILIKNMPSGEEILAKHINRYTKIAQKTESDDPRTSMIAMSSIEKLLKLHNPDVQINNNSLHLNLESVDKEDIMKLIRTIKTGEE
jgi:hypothetical protein